jgi:flagellar protein FlbD
MIQLTRLNGKPLAVNADLIKFVEESPDTVITLVTGEKLVVKEPVPDVLRLIFEYKRLLSQPTAAAVPQDGEDGASRK